MLRRLTRFCARESCAAFAWMLAAACASDDGSAGRDAGAVDVAGASGGAADTGVDQGEIRGDCPSGLPGPVLVKVPTPSGSGVASYCMDATEVTNAQYAEFLVAGVLTRGPPPECAWNGTYVPGWGWPADIGEEEHPISVADWCDAHAYCAWAGKRLCGRIGGRGDLRLVNADTTQDGWWLVNGLADFADATKNEWYNACSAGGAKKYPYGDTWLPTACQKATLEGGGTVPVASKETCEGGYSGLFDLSGNADEWEDTCTGATGGSDICQLRGTGFVRSHEMPGHEVDAEEFACDFGGFYGARNTTGGIRCCAD